MVMFTFFGFIVFCILLAVDLLKGSLAWWVVAMPLFIVAAMWISKELLAAFVDYMVRKRRMKARRRDGRVSG